MYWPNLKSVALPVPDIIGGTQKIGQSTLWIRPLSLFSKIFNGFVRMDPANVPAKFEVHSCTRSRDNSD